MKKAFSLVELLVVIACMAILFGLLMPAIAKARIQAKVTATNAELSRIAFAMETYGFENEGRFPPTRADCDPDARQHWWALPQELAAQGYLNTGKAGQVAYASAYDRFNPGYTYKYVAVGPRLDYYGTPTVQYLQIPHRFPAGDDEPYVMHSDPLKSPVKWMLFSLGPDFDEANLTMDGFPVARRFWYSRQTHKGIITWVRLDNERHMGTADGD